MSYPITSVFIIHKIRDLAKIRLLHNLNRSISTCDVNLDKYASREGKFMTKIMRDEHGGKRKWYLQSERPSPNSVPIKKTVIPRSNRRNTVLNKIFMKHITDLMATGEIAPDILGRGIEISRVSVTPDFNQVNVYWLARDNDEKDKLVEEILTRAEGPLRHELSQLRVMGVVPVIKFVRDKQYIRFVEIDRRLAVADFGEDFVPTDPTLRLKTMPVLNTKLPKHVWTDIEKLELDIDEDELERNEVPLPEMRHDVLGLDRARVMAKIQSSMDKSRTASQNRSLNIVSSVSNDTEQRSEVTEYLTVKQRNAAFSEFLAKRQLNEKKKRKYEMERYQSSEDEVYSFDQPDVNYDDEVLDIDIHSEKIQER